MPRDRDRDSDHRGPISARTPRRPGEAVHGVSVAPFGRVAQNRDARPPRRRARAHGGPPARPSGRWVDRRMATAHPRESMASTGPEAAVPGRPETAAGPSPLRPWQRLSVRLAAFFAAVTFLAVGAVGAMTYTRQQREVEDSVGTQLLNIARVAALDPRLHVAVDASQSPDSAGYRQARRAMAAIQDETLLTSPITILTGIQPGTPEAPGWSSRAAGPGQPGDPYPLAPELIEPMGWTLGDGVARYTRVYRHQGGLWISGFAPILDAQGRPEALLHVAYPVEIYLDRLHELRNTLLLASGVGALTTLVLGLLVLRRLTRPIALLTGGVSRVAAGDLSRPLRVTSRDEVGRLTQAFNSMLEGLRQRDFIRSAFGRYVSPEVAQAILESPEGLRFGGTKRIVTVLMSDLRGYTRFAEQGDPEEVMEILNGYLARMAEVVIAHGGTINEFIGDAIFAVYGAPVAHPDHAERAAATALAMQEALVEHQCGARPARSSGLRDGHRPPHGGGGRRQHRLRAAGEVRGGRQRGQRGEPRRERDGGGPGPSHRANAGRAGNAGPGRASDRSPGEGALRASHRPRAPGARGPVRASPAGAGPRPDARWPSTSPLECWVIDGKIVRPDALTGRLVRLEKRELHAQMAEPLAPADQREAPAPVPAAALPTLRGHLRQGAPRRRHGPRADAAHGGRPRRRAGNRTAARLGRGDR